jgi:NADH:ubiquinone oxidoreductase subunit C
MKVSDIRKDTGRFMDAHFSCISAFNAGKKLGLTYHFLDGKKPIDLTTVFEERTKIPSIADMFPSASLYETEAHEMFGVKFDKLERTKLFLSDDWKKKPPLRE